MAKSPLKNGAAKVSPELSRAATAPAADVLASLNSSPAGLAAEEAEGRLEQHGLGSLLAAEQRIGARLRRLDDRGRAGFLGVEILVLGHG